MTPVPWIVVGYMGSPVPVDIPRVLEMVVSVSDDQVMAIGAASGSIPNERFEELVAEGSGGLVAPRAFDDNRILFMDIMDTEPTYEPLEEVEAYLNKWVEICRDMGRNAITSQSALTWYDRARRVSNDADDYVRVWGLSSPEMRPIWEEWANLYHVDLAKRAAELGVAP